MPVVKGNQRLRLTLFQVYIIEDVSEGPRVLGSGTLGGAFSTGVQHTVNRDLEHLTVLDAQGHIQIQGRL